MTIKLRFFPKRTTAHTSLSHVNGKRNNMSVIMEQLTICCAALVTF